MLASQHQASPYSLERQAAAEQWGEYLRASDTTAVALIHLEQRSQTTAQLRHDDVHNTQQASILLKHPTSIPASLPGKQASLKLTAQDEVTQ